MRQAQILEKLFKIENDLAQIKAMEGADWVERKMKRYRDDENGY